MNSIHLMTLNRVKLGRVVILVKQLASLASLIFLQKTLIWNKVELLASNLLHFVELVVNEQKRVSPKLFINIPFSVRVITRIFFRSP